LLRTCMKKMFLLRFSQRLTDAGKRGHTST
jgi:hypothetical protein